MKRFIKSCVLAGSVLAVATTAHAINQADVKLTSPSVLKTGCEQLGSFTVKLDQHTTIAEGQWFYMDLPAGGTLCKDIDYVIVGGTWTNTGDTVQFDATTPTKVKVTGGITAIPALSAGVFAGNPCSSNSDTSGPLTFSGSDSYGTYNANTSAGDCAHGIIFRVTGASGSRRLQVTAYGTSPSPLVDSIYIDDPSPTANLTFHLVDGNAYQPIANGGILLNTKGINGVNNTFGDELTDIISLTKNVPHIEDTMCADVSAVVGDKVNVSFMSALKWLAFSGDSEVAHTNSTGDITLEGCTPSAYSKGGVVRNVVGVIPMPTAEQGTPTGCIFNYEPAPSSPAVSGYCMYDPTTAKLGFTGNRILLHAATKASFGDPNDQYDVNITSLTSGVFFGDPSNTHLYSFSNLSTAQDCKTAGNKEIPSTFFTRTDATGSLVTSGWDTGSCSPSARPTFLTTDSSGSITNLSGLDTVWVDLPSMVYDRGIVAKNVVAQVKVELVKYPCGSVVFSKVRDLGTFVESCDFKDAGSTTLLYPLFAAPNDTNWWASFNIVNASDVAGHCDLTLTDSQNDSFIYTTPDIAAHGMWVAPMMSQFVSSLTINPKVPTPTGGTGTVADANLSIVAECTFDKGAGAAVMGNAADKQGISYTAYVMGRSDNKNWQ